MSDALDLSGTDSAQAWTLLQQKFAAAAPGEALEILISGDAGGLLREMQKSHWGAFDWAPLEEVSGQGRYWVRKLDKPSQKRRLNEFLTSDHRRCDSVFTTLEEKAAAGDKEGTRLHFQRFERGMHRHFKMEEDLFFPAFEARTGMTRGPTMVMRMEHTTPSSPQSPPNRVVRSPL
ncbi:MAG: hemerythrin domain-containing protein, partial [Magnetococcales bacterium]|nr:hemerythrin domain-containing protein [Magnetococcales bacterium]